MLQEKHYIWFKFRGEELPSIIQEAIQIDPKVNFLGRLKIQAHHWEEFNPLGYLRKQASPVIIKA